MDDEALEALLQKQLAYWQKVLFLQDWTVELRMCRSWEMSDPSSLAECHWFIQRKDAIIRMLVQSDLAGVSDRFLNGEAADYDISLVHELLHLHFAPMHREEDETFHEQAINAISRGFVKVWREAIHPTPVHTPSVEQSGFYL